MRAALARPLLRRESTGADLYLPHEAMSAGIARGCVREMVSEWDDRDRVQEALLLTTELVCNAILHGRPDVFLRTSLAGSRLRVEVDDASPSLPHLRPAWAGGGRGLAIVEETADGWGVIPGPEGVKTVWFELRGE